MSISKPAISLPALVQIDVLDVDIHSDHTSNAQTYRQDGVGGGVGLPLNKHNPRDVSGTPVRHVRSGAGSQCYR